LYFLLALPLVLGFHLAFFDHRRILYGWLIAGGLLFASSTLGCVTDHAEMATVAAQTILPTGCGLALSLRLRRGDVLFTRFHGFGSRVEMHSS
jgi:hypothetical protein